MLLLAKKYSGRTSLGSSTRHLFQHTLTVAFIIRYRYLSSISRLPNLSLLLYAPGVQLTGVFPMVIPLIIQVRCIQIAVHKKNEPQRNPNSPESLTPSDRNISASASLRPRKSCKHRLRSATHSLRARVYQIRSALKISISEWSAPPS